MSVTRAALAIGLLAGAAALAAAVGHHAALRYEALTLARVEAARASLGLDWLEVAADGTRLTLSGRAPDDLARALAIETVGEAAPAAEIEDRLDTAPPTPTRRPPPRLELHRDGASITLLGLLPEADAPMAGLRRALSARAPDLWVKDLTAGNAAPWPAARPLSEGYPVAVEALLSITRARVVLEPDRIRIAGLAASDARRRDITARLLSRAPGGQPLEIDLKVPPPVIAPFRVALARHGAEGLRLETCAARSAEEAAELTAMMRRAGLSDVAGGCLAGAGGPPGDWLRAVAAGLAALTASPGRSRFEITYRSATLHVDGDLTAEALAAQERALRERLPAGFSARVIADPAPAESAPAAEPRELRGPWIDVTAAPDTLDLTGRVGSAASAAALEAVAAVRFPGRIVRGRLRSAGAAPPDAWMQAAQVALATLSELGEGRVRLTARRLLVDGTVPAPGLARTVHERLASALPEIAVETALTVDLPAVVRALPVSAERCAWLAGRALLERPLSFAPGSAVLEESAEAVLDRLADILATCPEAVLEIAGHTDSQGSAGFNLRLSQSRADAVRHALFARGLPRRRLATHGYGEARPKADNATKEGRALNRRIEITPVPTREGEG